MKVRIYKSPDGVGKVVNKTAQWMAQLGGAKAAQAAMNHPGQQEVDPEIENQIVQLIVPMINEEPSDILNDLVSNKGVPIEIAQPILMKVLAYKKQKEEADAVAMKQEPEEVEDAAVNERAIQEESQNEMLAEQMMMQQGNSQQQYAEEDQFFTDNIMAYGGKVNKNSYVKNVMNLLKKQQGDEIQGANIADDTDTGARRERLSNFVTTLQGSANEALMKQDAENMYQQEFRRGGTTRQQRQINKGLNKIIRNTPLGIYNTSMPMMPPMMGIIGAQNIMPMMPATGSIPGGIKTANIDVKRTGLFGRPKEYSLSLTYNEPMTPQLYRQMMEQEEYNSRVSTEEDAKEYAQERVNTATNENEKVQEEEGKVETDESKSKYVAPGTQKETPAAAPRQKPAGAKPSAASSAAPAPAVTPTGSMAGSILDRFTTPEAQAAYQEGMRKLQERQEKIEAVGDYLSDWFNEKVYGKEKEEDVKSYKYASQFTDPGALYYDPNKKGIIYGRKDNQWFYSEDGQQYKPVTDTKRLSHLNKSAKGANLFTIASKPGFYYRQRGDGSFERFQGDPNKHTEGKKSSGIISTSDPNYAYVNKSKKYTVTYMPTKQIGGFVDPSRPDLNRFTYGGNEPMSFADEVPMTNTADPYFREGGLTKYQTAGQTRGDWERSKGIKSEPTPINGSTRYYYDATWDGEKFVEPSGSTNTDTYDNNTTNTFGTDEMPAWFKEWAAQNMPYNNPYIGNYNMYNPYDMAAGYGQAPMYPPLFGGRRFRPPARFIDYAGSWVQQQGMPMIAGTNTPFMGSLMGARPTKIDVTKTSWLTGLPKKWSADFYVPGAPVGSLLANYQAPQRFIQDEEGNIIDTRPNTAQTDSNTDLPGAFGPRSDKFMQKIWKNRAERKGYDVDWSTDGFVSPTQKSPMLPPPQFTDEELGINELVNVEPEIFPPSYSDKELGLDQLIDIQPETFNMADLQSMGYEVTPEDFYNERLANENQAARQEFELEQLRRAQGANRNYEYGGYLPKAQFGDFNASGCPPGYIKGADGVCRKMFTNEPYFSKPEATMPSAESFMENPFDLDENYVNPLTGESPAIRMGDDGTYVNEGVLDGSERHLGQKVTADYKNKNMFTIDPVVGLLGANRFVDWSSRFAGAFRDRDSQNQFYANLPFTNQPVKEIVDRGNYQTNTGLFKPDQMGQILSSKKGGSTYKKGGVTYLSSKQVQDLMKKGYKLEFIK